jgi:restriction endonuclease
MAHRFILKAIDRSSDKEVQIELDVDNEKKIFSIKKGELIGYAIPGELENLDIKRIGKVRELVEIVDEFLNGSQISLPVDLSYSDW